MRHISRTWSKPSQSQLKQNSRVTVHCLLVGNHHIPDIGHNIRLNISLSIATKCRIQGFKVCQQVTLSVEDAIFFYYDNLF